MIFGDRFHYPQKRETCPATVWEDIDRIVGGACSACEVAERLKGRQAVGNPDRPLSLVGMIGTALNDRMAEGIGIPERGNARPCRIIVRLTEDSRFPPPCHDWRERETASREP